MRLFAVHDSEGTILQVVVSPDAIQGLTFQTPPGLSFTEVDPPDPLPDDDELDDFLPRFMASNKVDTTSSRKGSVIARSNE